MKRIPLREAILFRPSRIKRPKEALLIKIPDSRPRRASFFALLCDLGESHFPHPCLSVPIRGSFSLPRRSPPSGEGGCAFPRSSENFITDHLQIRYRRKMPRIPCGKRRLAFQGSTGNPKVRIIDYLSLPGQLSPKMCIEVNGALPKRQQGETFVKTDQDLRPYPAVNGSP